MKIIVGLLLFSLSLHVLAQEFGFTEGNFNVTESGSASYQIPISVPPGTGGMQPDLALVYNSFGGNGIVGVGWSLAGLSNITVGAANYEQDGYRGAPIVGAVGNRFLLDGDRLVLTRPGPNDYGVEYSNYRKEIDDQTKIISRSVDNKGVDYFQAFTKSGLIYEYGSTVDSQLRFTSQGYCFTCPPEEQPRGYQTSMWSLNRISDTKGNYIKYNYENYVGLGPGGGNSGTPASLFPKSIEYTLNDKTGLTAINVIEFQYEIREDIIDQNILNTQMRIAQRLNRIVVKSNGNVVREYELIYSFDVYSKLVEVKEIGLNSNEFSPTMFTWNVPLKSGISRTENAFQKKEGLNDFQVLPNDWNRDGLTDLFFYQKSDGLNEMQVNTSDLSSNYFTTNNQFYINPELIAGGNGLINVDLDGNGYTDLVWYNQLSGELQSFINTKTSFQSIGQIIPPDLVKSGIILWGDWNGDARSDYVWIGASAEEKWFINNTFNNQVSFLQLKGTNTILQIPPEGFFPVGSVPDSKTLANSELTPIITDIDGDGNTDFFLYERSTGDNLLVGIDVDQRSNYPGLITNKFGAKYDKTEIQNGNIYFGNVLGGPSKSLIWIDPQTGYNKIFTGNEPNLNSIDTTFLKGDSLDFFIYDYNGDQLDDFLVYDNKTGRNHWIENNGPTRDPYIFLASGTTLNFELDPTLDLNPFYITGGNGIQFGDWNGSGTSNPLWWDDIGNNNLFFLPFENTNKITQIKEGNGFTIDITYSNLNDKEIYQKETNSIYPTIDFVGALEVVKSYNVSNGIGGKNTFKYFYQGAKFNTQGRGFRGFAKLFVTDKQTGLQNIAFYDRRGISFGFDLTREEQRTSNDILLRSTDYQRRFSGSQIYDNSGALQRFRKAFVTKKTTVYNKLDGSHLKTIQERYTYDEFSPSLDLKGVAIDYGDGHIDSTYSTYANDIDNWIIGRIASIHYGRKTPGNPFQWRESSFEYDPDGLLIKEIIEPNRDNLRIVKEYEYDHYGNRIQETSSGFDGKSISQRTITTFYDSYGRFPSRKLNPLNHQNSFSYDGVWGNVLTLTGPNGITTAWSYDDFGRKINESRADGVTIVKQYRWCENGDCPENGNYYVVSQQTGQPKSITYYDLLGREIRSETSGFNGEIIYVDKQYTQEGYLLKESDPYFEGDLPQWTEYSYDEIGRVTKVIQPGNRATTYFYNGLIKITRNALGQTKTRITNPVDRVVEVIDNNGSSLLLEYDAFGNLTKSQDPSGNIITNQYDILGNLISQSDPDLGNTSLLVNAFGKVIQKTDQKGNEFTYSYDLLDRMIEIIQPEGRTQWVYDLSSNGRGKLSSVASFESVENYYYDTFGRLSKTIRTIRGEEFTTTNSYNSEGKLEWIMYPSGFAVKHNYNIDGYLESIVDQNQKIVWQLEEVNARGHLVSQTYGNNAQTIQVFDDVTGRKVGITTEIEGSNIQNLAYDFDDLGNVISREDRLTKQKEIFQYDGLNRLAISDIIGGAKLRMEYDNIGNITFKSDIGEFKYDSGRPHALSQINLIQDTDRSDALPRTDITYTSFNKVESLISGDRKQLNHYDATYQRVVVERFAKGIIKETQYYVSSYFEQVIKEDTIVSIHYIRGPNNTVATYTTNSFEETGEYHYWHRDHIESLESITDDSGNVVERLSYDVWGSRRNPQNWNEVYNAHVAEPNRGFTGHEHYDWFGLIEMNGRVFNPITARFTSPDPFIIDLENIQSYNRYSYVNNNPLTYIDPSGYFPDFIGDLIGGAIKEVGRHVQRVAKEVGRFVEKNKDILITIAAVGVGIASMGAGTALVASLGGGAFAASIGAAAGFGFGFAASSTLFAGGSVGDALKAGTKAAVISGVTAGLTFGVGEVLSHPTVLGNVVGKAASHGIVQGLYTDAMGGEFEHGFISGATIAFSQIGINNIQTPGGRVLASALVGGTSSAMGGGKFVNGAISGSMIRIYNEGDLFDRLAKRGVELKREAIRLYKKYTENAKGLIRGGKGINNLADWADKTSDNIQQNMWQNDNHEQLMNNQEQINADSNPFGFTGNYDENGKPIFR